MPSLPQIPTVNLDSLEVSTVFLRVHMGCISLMILEHLIQITSVSLLCNLCRSLASYKKTKHRQEYTIEETLFNNLWQSQTRHGNVASSLGKCMLYHH